MSERRRYSATTTNSTAAELLRLLLQLPNILQYLPYLLTIWDSLDSHILRPFVEAEESYRQARSRHRLFEIMLLLYLTRQRTADRPYGCLYWVPLSEPEILPVLRVFIGRSFVNLRSFKNTSKLCFNARLHTQMPIWSYLEVSETFGAIKSYLELPEVI